MALPRLPPVPVQETDSSAVQSDSDSAISTETLEPVAATRKAPRVLAPDLLRGVAAVLQALDHAAVSVNAWPHGLAVESEADGQIVNRWNGTTGWTARMLTHLCAPAFLFLLGMGIVYFGKSRRKLGWSTWRLVKHFFARCVILILASQFVSFAITGRPLFILNIILYALAINYFLAGILWIMLNPTEAILTDIFGAFFCPAAPRDETQPLLRENTNVEEESLSLRAKARTAAFHTVNLLVLLFSIVTICWNVWLSPDNGRCRLATRSQSTSGIPPQELMVAPTIFAFFFYTIETSRIISNFPPLAWISFALLGILYARLLTHYKPEAIQAATATAVSGIVFAAGFVSTRIFHIGNLTEDCLRMSENLAAPTENQYFASLKAFFYTAKYPPDVAFFCYTMAVNMWLLSIFSLLPSLESSGGNTVSQVASALLSQAIHGIALPFGQAALFFYVAHLLSYNLFAPLIRNMFGHKLDWYDKIRHEPANGVGDTPIFWIFYLSGLLILGLACRYYAKFKARKGPDSIWRFF